MTDQPARGISRRSMIKGIGAGTAVMWTAPVISTLGTRASAASAMTYDLGADYHDAPGGNVNPPWSYFSSSSGSPDTPAAPLALYQPLVGTPGTIYAFEGG